MNFLAEETDVKRTRAGKSGEFKESGEVQCGWSRVSQE